MRNAVLHRLLETYTVDTSSRLVAAMAAGAELPYELGSEPTVSGPGGPVFYTYTPLTGAFIDSSRELLAQLPSHEPAVRALSECEALDVYLAQRGEVRMPAGRRALAEAALTAYLRAVFAERLARQPGAVLRADPARADGRRLPAHDRGRSSDPVQPLT